MLAETIIVTKPYQQYVFEQFIEEHPYVWLTLLGGAILFFIAFAIFCMLTDKH